MKVLIACEYSGRVRDAFLDKGLDAISADILPTEKKGPHYQGDVRDILYEDWDMIIAFPPCTYLSKAGARWMYPKGNLNHERYRKALKAKEFFMLFYNHPCKKICIENTQQMKIMKMPKRSQYVQPWMFGHTYTKSTWLWLKGLPPLKETLNVKKETFDKPPKQRLYMWNLPETKDRARIRSATPIGLARAMADQWSGYESRQTQLFAMAQQ